MPSFVTHSDHLRYSSRWEASIPFLQPLAVLHVALATRHVLHLPCIDQPDRQPALFQHFVDRYPVNTRRFERDRVDSAREQPVGHRVQVVGHRAEFPNRLLGR